MEDHERCYGNHIIFCDGYILPLQAQAAPWHTTMAANEDQEL